MNESSEKPPHLLSLRVYIVLWRPKYARRITLRIFACRSAWVEAAFREIVRCRVSGLRVSISREQVIPLAQLSVVGLRLF